MDWLLRIFICAWLVAHVILVVEWRNRVLRFLADKIRPLLTYFSMDCKWAMFVSNKERGWFVHDKFFVRLHLADGRVLNSTDVFDFGSVYHLYLFKTYEAFHNQALWPDHIRFVEARCEELGLPLVRIEFVRARRLWPEKQVPFLFGRNDHPALLNTPFTEKVIMRHQIAKQPAAREAAA